MFKWLEANNQWLMYVYAGVLVGILLVGALSVAIAYFRDWNEPLDNRPLSAVPTKAAKSINYFDAMDSLCESIADSPSAANLQYTMLVYQLQEAGIEYDKATQAARRLMLEVFECPLPPPPLFPRQEPR